MVLAFEYAGHFSCDLQEVKAIPAIKNKDARMITFFIVILSLDVKYIIIVKIIKKMFFTKTKKVLLTNDQPQNRARLAQIAGNGI